MAQGRLEFEVTFQSLHVTNTWSCDWYLMPAAEYVPWKILLHEQIRRGIYYSKFFTLQGGFFFFISHFVCLDFKKLTHKQVCFSWPRENCILRIITSGPNWTLIHARVSSKPQTVSDSGLWFRCIFLMKINYIWVSLQFQRPKRLQRD